MVPNLVLVEPGDTLSSIAKAMLGDEKYAGAIAAINNIPNPEAIRPGMVLQMPQLTGDAPKPARPVEVSVGKITQICFGPDPDAQDQLSLRVELLFDGRGTTDRIYDMEAIRKLMLQAKILTITALRGAPVQVTTRGNQLLGWRILTEVL